MPVMPNGNFDPSQHSDMRDNKPIPIGKYVSKISNQELKETADKTGQMLIITETIAAGPYAGKSVITRLNLVNKSAQAVKIANEEFATLSRSCGHPEPIQNSDILNGIAHVITLSLIPAEGKYGPKNEIVLYESAAGLTTYPVNPEPDEAQLAIINGMAPVAATPQAPAAPPVAPAGFAPPPPVTPAAAPPAAPAGFAAPPAATAPSLAAPPATPPAAVQPAAVAPSSPAVAAPPSAAPPW